MIKSLIASIAFIALAAGLSSAPAAANEFGGATIEKANFATYTPSMAARGQRFYVGDWLVSHPQTLKEDVMKKIITIIGGLFLLSASISPVLAFDNQFNPHDALNAAPQVTVVKVASVGM